MTAPTGRVYDRGYRPYDGELGGRRAARRALARASIRRALGLRRSWRQKFFPWLLLAIATVPAVVNVGVAYITRDQPFQDQVPIITYREYVGISTVLIVFVALTAPDVLCPDRRNRSLPLYFSRPLTGGDYVGAKLAAITSVIFAFSVIPHIVLFVGQLFVADAALDYATDNADVLWKVPASVLVQSVFYATLALAMASFTTRRLVAAAAFLLTMLVTSVTAGVIAETGDGTSLWAVVNLGRVPLYLRDVIFIGEAHFDSPLWRVDGGTSAALAVYVVVLAAGLATLAKRYRWAQA